MKIKLKDSIYILEEQKDTYQIIFTSTRKIKRFKVDELTKEIIGLLNKPKENNYLIQKLSEKYCKENITSCISSLRNFGVIVDDYKPKNKRFEKQISFINELTNSYEETMKLQSKIENSAIAVFGVGGIGTWIVNGLYQTGVGEIRITDPDVIDITNLNRQLYFTSKDIGKYKVDVIKEKLPDAKIKIWKKYVDKRENLEDIIKDCNFLINCADNPSVAETTEIISQYANKLNIPYCVAGGYNMHLGMVGPIIIPGKTACFNCFLEYQKENDLLKGLKKIKDIEQTGNLGPIAGAIANLQVMEIFKYLIGRGEININKFAEIDFINSKIEWRHFDRRKNCDC